MIGYNEQAIRCLPPVLHVSSWDWIHPSRWDRQGVKCGWGRVYFKTSKAWIRKRSLCLYYQRFKKRLRTKIKKLTNWKYGLFVSNLWMSSLGNATILKKEIWIRKICSISDAWKSNFWTTTVLEKELKTCQAWNLQAGSSKTFLLCQFHIFKFLFCKRIWIANHRSTLQKGISFPTSFVNVVLLWKIFHFLFLTIVIVFFIQLGSKIYP